MKNYSAHLKLFFLLAPLIFACKKKLAQPENISITPVETVVLKIPVVVHVISSENQFDISDAKIASQIAVINQDFRRLNPDFSSSPQAYIGLGADIGLTFELAKIDPNGNPSTGITRTTSLIDGWNGRTPANENLPAAQLALYHTAKGGHDAWPSNKYLNIYVTTMSDHTGTRVGLSGYAQLPGKDPLTDGIVIDPRCFGLIQPLGASTNLGRTVTHEIGHWLNLKHVFADPTDEVEDTPYGHMAGNFMDYASDDQMTMFTLGQKQRMRAVFAPNGPRYAMYQYLIN